MDLQDARATLHNAVGYATWCETRALRVDSILDAARREGRHPSPSECREVMETLPEMLRRSAEVTVLMGVLATRAHAPWWTRLPRWVRKWGGLP